MTFSEATRRSWVIGVLLIGLICLCVLSLPIWQVHDDVYYSMIVQGWGIVAAPSADLPFMHPAVGQLAAWVTQVTGSAGYAIVVFALLGAGLLVGLYALHRLQASQALCCLFVGASAPLFLVPQYTVVAAYLAMMVTLLWLSDARRGAVLAAAALLIVSAALRTEMALLAAAVAAPFVVAAWQRGRRSGWQVASLGLLLSAVVGVVAISSPVMRSQGLVDFNNAHAPLVPFVDYGLAAIESKASVGPVVAPLDPVERELLTNWFLADAALFPAERLNALASAVTWEERFASYRWKARQHLTQLHELLYFWMLLAAVVVGFASGRARLILLSSALFLGADLLFSCIGRPFPERVGLGLSVGVFALALTEAEAVSGTGTGNGRLRLVVAGATVSLLLGFSCLYKEYFSTKDWNVGPLRTHLKLHASDIVYFQTGYLPLQTLFRPLGDESKALPRLVSLGGMFNHPARKIVEAMQGCTFVECLRSGRIVRLYASETYLKTLARYAEWKFGRPLEVLRSETIGEVRFHELRVATAVTAP